MVTLFQYAEAVNDSSRYRPSANVDSEETFWCSVFDKTGKKNENALVSFPFFGIYSIPMLGFL